MNMRFSTVTSAPRRRAFSLVEAAIATVLVGGLLVTSLNLLGASRMTQARYADREQALILAEDLLGEVLARPYEDPDDGVSVNLGLELGETLALRVGLDDADDYDGYAEAPPRDADGAAIPGASGFRRAVQVAYVDPDALNTAVADDRGVKRIVVVVERGDTELCRLTGYHTAAWPDADGLAEADP